MYLDTSEEVTLRTMVAWYLPFGLGRFIDPIVCRISDVKMCNALMETTVLNFPNVSSLIIFEGSGPSPQSQPDPLFVNAYTACASNLRTLSLTATSTNFTVLFPPNASALTSLEEFTLTFSPQDGSSADAEAASTFLQAISPTLTSLNISFHCTSDEPSRLLPNPPCEGNRTGFRFPKLTSFSLFHSELPASPGSNLMQFLNQHADTLKHLHLQPTKPSPIASQFDLDPLLPSVLPHLETLNLLNGSSSRNGQQLASSEGLDAARAYLQHSGSTLTRLGLTHCSFTLHDLGMLLDLLGQGSSENVEGGGLKNLTVTVQVLSPQVLDMLAEKLPQLERLKVDFADLRSNHGADVPMWMGEGSRVGLGGLTHEVQPWVSWSFCLSNLTFSFSLIS
jgi:hypothetical protein